MRITEKDKLKDVFEYSKNDSFASFETNVFMKKPKSIQNFTELLSFDKKAEQYIKELHTAEKLINEYRQALFERAKQLQSSSYTYQMNFYRKKNYFDKLVFYYIEIIKVYDDTTIQPEKIINETFTGKERKKAIERATELKKAFNGITYIENLEKKEWEK